MTTPTNPDVPSQEELEGGYTAAQDLYGKDYADYLREHDSELIAKGFALRPWPLSLQGNDGD